MNEFVFAALIVLTLAASLGILATWANWRADEAETRGELRYWARGLWKEQVIRRADNPNRFEIEIKILRSVPWISAVMTAFGILLIGLLL